MPADYLPGLFWLLLPIAAASGWYLARRTAPRPLPQLGPSYVKGLNYLLNEQPDKAIEVFLQMLEVDGETVETHLALGNLFRRRGEVDRAIRIHENLIARPALTSDQRWLAVQELGIDYMRSGLMDRAEGLFKELLEAKVQVRKALGHLMDIYQQEQDWDTAIACATDLRSRCGDDTRPMIAQFHCEKAERHLAHGDGEKATESLQEARFADPDCVRSNLMEGRLAMAAGRPAEALAAYQRIEKQDPDFLVEALPPLMLCYRASGVSASSPSTSDRSAPSTRGSRRCSCGRRSLPHKRGRRRPSSTCAASCANDPPCAVWTAYWNTCSRVPTARVANIWRS